MNATTSAIGGALGYETIVGPGGASDSMPGVAALDSHGLQQTKSEIRNLATELAQLAQAALEPADFFGGFLPRLCAAMGAKGAGVWKLDHAASPVLIANHQLPTTLFLDPADSDKPVELNDIEQSPSALPSSLRSPRTIQQPSSAHLRILQCVAAEAQPILVPPGNVKLETERPTNPIGDALIVIPLRLEERVEFLLEVVQRPSGGPAAQRGYLRFVAQMGDLMADYLRRQQLREYAAGERRRESIEAWLTAIASATTVAHRQQLVADAIEELFSAERVILCNGLRRQSVVAISGTRALDPRSETVLAARAVHEQFMQLKSSPDSNSHPLPHSLLRFHATDRRQTPHPQIPDGHESGAQAEFDTLCETIACRHGVCVALDAGRQWSAIITYAAESSAGSHDVWREPSSNGRLLAAFAGQLQVGQLGFTWFSQAGLSQFLPHGPWDRLVGRRTFRPARSSKPTAIQSWLMRVALLSLAALVAFFSRFPTYHRHRQLTAPEQTDVLRPSGRNCVRGFRG